MKHVLFVDDDQNVLSGLRRILRPYHLEWRMEFCNSADDALRVLAESHIDVVVTDMRMPGKDGAELLTEVRATYPGVVRIGLSGYFSEETTLRAIGLAHQYLSKPCEPETLKYTIIRACALRDHLSDDRLKRLVSRMNTIPSLPTNYQAIVNELHSADPSLPRIGDIIARDMSMTAKVLQLVNSSFFGLARRVTNPTDAATMLGLNTVHALALSAGAFSQLGSDDLGEFSMDALMSHSLAVGHFARAIAATQTRDSQIIDDAFVGGVLHDVGKLVLAANFCEEYSAVLTAHRDSGLSLSAHEYETFGASHADIGAYLMALWGLPSPLVEAIAFHHYPGKCSGTGFGPLAAVHAANALVHQQSDAEHGPAEVDHSYLWGLGLLSHLGRWQAMVAAGAPAGALA